MSWTGAESDLRLVLALVAGVSILLAGWFRERQTAISRPWRYVALTLVAVAIAGMIVRPSWSRRVTGQTGLLLTPGTDVESAESEYGELERSLLSAALPGVESWSPRTVRVPDLATWLRNNPQIEHLRVLGAGLEPWDLQGLTQTVGVFGTADRRPGVQSVAWQRSLTPGDRLLVTGSLSGVSGETFTLELLGPTGTCDSTEVAVESEDLPVRFSLQCKPPGEGRFLYRLAVKVGAETLDSNAVVDVQVRPVEMPSILWLEDSPSFEAKHFKRWLQRVGGRVAIRSRVSRRRYHFEFHNLEQVTLELVTSELLEGFDLAVVGERAWNRLSATERSAILQQVEESAFGLLIRLNSERKGDPRGDWPLEFSGTRVEGTDSLRVRIEGLEREPSVALETGPYELALDPGMTPLAVDPSGRVLTASRPLGGGSVAATLLDETYPWVLAGDGGTQQAYWRGLIEVLARPSSKSRWHVGPGPILVDEPVDPRLDWSPSEVSEPEARFGPVGGELASLPMRQDVGRATLWTGRVWPSTPGWYRLSASGTTMDFYVAEAGAWPAWQLGRRERATALASLRQPVLQGQTATLVETPVPRSPFFVVLLVSLGLLWLDEKR